MLFLLQLALAFVLSISPEVAEPRPGNFHIIGPGGGGAMFHPTISPHDPRTVLIACDMTGSYISHDGGDSWRMFSLRGVVRFFVFDPLDRESDVCASRRLVAQPGCRRHLESGLSQAVSAERNQDELGPR